MHVALVLSAGLAHGGSSPLPHVPGSFSGTQHKTGGAGDEVAGQRVIQQAGSEGSMPRPGGAHWVTERGKEGRRQGGRAGWQSVSR